MHKQASGGRGVSRKVAGRGGRDVAVHTSHQLLCGGPLLHAFQSRMKQRMRELGVPQLHHTSVSASSPYLDDTAEFTAEASNLTARLGGFTLSQAEDVGDVRAMEAHFTAESHNSMDVRVIDLNDEDVSGMLAQNPCD